MLQEQECVMTGPRRHSSNYIKLKYSKRCACVCACTFFPLKLSRDVTLQKALNQSINWDFVALSLSAGLSRSGISSGRTRCVVWEEVMMGRVQQYIERQTIRLCCVALHSACIELCHRSEEEHRNSKTEVQPGVHASKSDTNNYLTYFYSRATCFQVQTKKYARSVSQCVSLREPGSEEGSRRMSLNIIKVLKLWPDPSVAPQAWSPEPSQTGLVSVWVREVRQHLTFHFTFFILCFKIYCIT